VAADVRARELTELFERRCIISGVGQSDIGRRLGRSDMDLTLDACLAAIADAGLEPSDIDGMISWPGDVMYTGGLTAGSPGFSGPSVPSVKDALRLELKWHFAGPEGPAMLGSVVNACMAVAIGLCRHVLVYRTLTESTAQAGGGRKGIPVYSRAATGWLRTRPGTSMSTGLAVSSSDGLQSTLAATRA
jgi:acetyl-CoA acetyltransferase